MNPDIKLKWVEALRSGEYAQGKNYLNRNNKYCCLGILCELAVEAGVAEKVTSPMDGAFRYGTDDPTDEYGYNSSYLPPSVTKWAEVDENGLIPLKPDGTKVRVDRRGGGDATDSLAVLNDDGFTFEQIAAIIEEHF